MMTFEDLLNDQREKYLHNWSYEKRELLRLGYNTAVKECAEIAKDFADNTEFAFYDHRAKAIYKSIGSEIAHEISKLET